MKYKETKFYTCDELNKTIMWIKQNKTMVNCSETQQHAMPCDESHRKDKHNFMMMKYRTVKTLVVKKLWWQILQITTFCQVLSPIFMVSIVFPKQMGFSLPTFFCQTPYSPHSSNFFNTKVFYCMVKNKHNIMLIVASYSICDQNLNACRHDSYYHVCIGFHQLCV